MKYITYYDNYKPIKVNSYKPFKVKENLPKSIQFLQKRIKSIKKRLQDNNKIQNRSKLNNDLNDNIRKLSDLTRYQIRQAEYLKNNPIVENIDNES